MFDLGMQELILIFVVALLVFGPKKLPELSRALGKGVRELKMALRGVKDSFDEAEGQIEESISKVTELESPGEDKSGETVETQKQTKQDLSEPVIEGDKEKTDDG